MTVNLFPDQTIVFNRAKAAMAKHKSILIRAETGFGKTILSLFMIMEAIKKNNECWFVVPRKQLMKQTSMSFVKEGLPVGYIASGYTPNKNKLVQLCSAPTLVNRLETLHPPKIMFLDECDYGGAGIDAIVEWAKSHGVWIIGLTATPWKMNGRGLGCWFDYMVDGPSLSELIEMKRLSEYRVFAPQTPDMSGVKKTNGDYNVKQSEEVMDRVLVGNAIDHYKEHAMGSLALGFAVSVKKALEMSDMFNDAGVPAGCIHGGMTEDDQDEVIMKFARREYKVLTNVEIAVFGFDLSQRAQMDVNIETMVDCQPTTSLRKQRQKNGRVLRMKDFPALIFDHAGNVHNHGMPDDDQEWTLQDREKKKGGNSEPTMPTKQCSMCYFVSRPSPNCPNCGHEHEITAREIEEIAGELEEIKRVTKKKEARMEQGQAKTLDDLIELGRSRGYKNPRAWATRVFNGRRR